MESDTPTLKFWHGAQRWSGHPELRPSRPKCYECGPGFYLSNHQSTARKYARGGGQTVLVEIAPDVVILEESWLSLADQLQGLNSLPRVRGRKEIEAGLRKSAQRHPDGLMPAEYLMNYCVNYESLGGESGPALARWYTSKGIDLSVYSRPGGEDWVVVFNPAKVIFTQVLKADAAWEQGDFKGFATQREGLVSSPSPQPSKSASPGP